MLKKVSSSIVLLIFIPASSINPKSNLIGEKINHFISQSCSFLLFFLYKINLDYQDLYLNDVFLKLNQVFKEKKMIFTKIESQITLENLHFPSYNLTITANTHWQNPTQFHKETNIHKIMKKHSLYKLPTVHVESPESSEATCKPFSRGLTLVSGTFKTTSVAALETLNLPVPTCTDCKKKTSVTYTL